MSLERILVVLAVVVVWGGLLLLIQLNARKQRSAKGNSDRKQD